MADHAGHDLRADSLLVLYWPTGTPALKLGSNLAHYTAT
jgi:hypothetical protein